MPTLGVVRHNCLQPGSKILQLHLIRQARLSEVGGVVVQVTGYNFSEKYSTGGVIGVLASDTVELGAINIK